MDEEAFVGNRICPSMGRIWMQTNKIRKLRSRINRLLLLINNNAGAVAWVLYIEGRESAHHITLLRIDMSLW